MILARYYMSDTVKCWARVTSSADVSCNYLGAESTSHPTKVAKNKGHCDFLGTKENGVTNTVLDS